MLKLQDRLNSLINPQWIDGGARFLRAAFVESAEALEHYGWKWWKKQSTDLPQVQMELIDILHFYLSHTLVSARGDRKSTRLNSSHVKISYAVFCLKKKITCYV